MAPAILIAGPTASGKSALAIAVAKALGGVVVNADSMQVYGDLRIITARPTPEEEAGVEHRLFGHVDAAVNYSVGLWLADAGAALADIRGIRARSRAGRRNRHVFQGADAGPLRHSARCPRTCARASGRRPRGVAPQDLHARLAARDPVTAARLRPSDPQRILRALEVLEASGPAAGELPGHAAGAHARAGGLAGSVSRPDREELYRRIDARFDAMMEAGRRRGGAARWPRAGSIRRLPAMRAHGVPGLIAWLRGEVSREEAIAQGKPTRAITPSGSSPSPAINCRPFAWAASAAQAQAMLIGAERD